MRRLLARGRLLPRPRAGPSHRREADASPARLLLRDARPPQPASGVRAPPRAAHHRVQADPPRRPADLGVRIRQGTRPRVVPRQALPPRAPGGRLMACSTCDGYEFVPGDAEDGNLVDCPDCRAVDPRPLAW